MAGVTSECVLPSPCGSHPRLCSRWLPVSLRLRRPLADKTTSPPPSGVVSAEVTLPPPLPPVRAGEALGLPDRPAQQTLTCIVLLEAGGQGHKHKVAAQMGTMSCARRPLALCSVTGLRAGCICTPLCCEPDGHCTCDWQA